MSMAPSGRCTDLAYALVKAALIDNMYWVVPNVSRELGSILQIVIQAERTLATWLDKNSEASVSEVFIVEVEFV